MHVGMVLGEPFLTFLHRTTELAVLGALGISLWFLARGLCDGVRVDRMHTSGGKVQTGTMSVSSEA